MMSANNTYPLFYGEDPAEAELYLSRGGDPNQTFGLGKTPLCFVRSPEQAAVLLAAGAAVNGNDLTTPLHWVKDAPTVRTLIEAGADVNKKDKFNETPVFSVRNKAQAQVLVEAGAKIDLFNLFQTSPIHYLQDIEIAKYFVEIGGDVNFHIDKSPYPMETITDLEILKFFFSRGGMIPRRKKSDLINENTSFEHLQLYLEAGANPMMINKWGKTPAHCVTDVKSLKLLFEKKISVNCRDTFGRTPLYYVKNKECLLFLLEQKNIELQLSDHAQKNPLHTISDPELLYLLAWHGMDVNQQDKEGNTPLHYHLDSTEKLRCLLICGADPCIPNHQGHTPLELTDSQRVLALLYYSGADVQKKDIQGKTIWDRGNSAVRKFIEAKQIAMPVFNNFIPDRSDGEELQNKIPPDLIEVMKSGDRDYFDAMLDIYADENMMADIFHYLLQENNYSFCKFLIINQKLPQSSLETVKSLLYRYNNSAAAEMLKLL